MRPQPDIRVIEWMDAQDESMLFTCAPVAAEIRYGVAEMPESRRKELLSARVEELLQNKFRGRVLAFDASASIAYAHIVARRRQLGVPIMIMDAMIAAIAISVGAKLATRNTRHFVRLDLELVDPFAA